MNPSVWTFGTNITTLTPTQPNQFSESTNNQSIDKINTVTNYASLSKTFIETYAATSQYSIELLEQYYHSNPSISLKLHQSSGENLHEFGSFLLFKVKLSELGIKSMKYTTAKITSQPIGKNSMFILLHGTVEINNKKYSTISSFVIRSNLSLSKIYNHIIEIFT